MAYDSIAYETGDATARLTLDRPDALNALTPDLLTELEDALERAADDADVRVVVLSGAGEAFSAGYDIGEGEAELGSIDDRIRQARTHLDTIVDLPLPVIASVDGPALAGGCNLAVAADLTYATERATFGYPDMHFGELPAKLVLPFVTNSLKDARELLYTGKTISATRAAEMGLVNRVVTHDDLESTVQTEIDHIRKTPGSMVLVAKELLNEVQEAQGDRRGRIDEFLATLTMETTTPKQFRTIREEQGFQAALTWMHETNKE